MDLDKEAVVMDYEEKAREIVRKNWDFVETESVIQDIAAAIQEAVEGERETNMRLREALTKAEEWFQEESDIHFIKGTTDGNIKATTNMARAAICRRALSGEK